MKQILTNPELSFGLSLTANSPFKPSLNAKFLTNWKVVTGIVAVLLLLYWTGNLESKTNEQKN